MNLNKIAGRVLAGVGAHEFEPVVWYCCLGQENRGGVIRPIYAEGFHLRAQTRTASDAVLEHADMVGMNEVTRLFYFDGIAGVGGEWSGVSSDRAGGGLPGGLVRRSGKSEDMILYRERWWKVDAVVEDFGLMGWVRVRAVMQTTPPDFTASGFS
jgi:hypothetical protein